MQDRRATVAQSRRRARERHVQPTPFDVSRATEGRDSTGRPRSRAGNHESGPNRRPSPPGDITPGHHVDPFQAVHYEHAAPCGLMGNVMGSSAPKRPSRAVHARAESRVVRPCRASASAPRRSKHRAGNIATRPRCARSGGKAERRCVTLESLDETRSRLCTRRQQRHPTPQTYDEGSEQGATVRDVSIKFASANRCVRSRRLVGVRRAVRGGWATSPREDTRTDRAHHTTNQGCGTCGTISRLEKPSAVRRST
jgi:hypothetical protein